MEVSRRGRRPAGGLPAHIAVAAAADVVAGLPQLLARHVQTRVTTAPALHLPDPTPPCEVSAYPDDHISGRQRKERARIGRLARDVVDGCSFDASGSAAHCAVRVFESG